MKTSELKKAKEVVEGFLEKLGVKAKANVYAVEEYLKVEIDGPDSSLLIGFHGDNLKALRHLLSIVLRKEVSEELIILVDVSHYLDRREEKIKEMAKKVIDKVKKTGRPQELPPLNAFERRIAHSYITEQGLKSESQGEGRERHIVVSSQQ